MLQVCVPMLGVGVFFFLVIGGFFVSWGQHLSVCTKHQDTITFLSGKGNNWITADASNQVILWDLIHGRSVIDWVSPEIRQIEMSPDAKKCAILSKKILSIIDLQNNKARKITLDNLPIEKIAWSRSGDSIITLIGQEVVGFALDSTFSRNPKPYIQLIDRIIAYQFSDTFLTLMTVNWDEEEFLQVYSIYHDEPIFQQKLPTLSHTFWLQNTTDHPSRLVVSKPDNSIQVIDIKTKKEYASFIFHQKQVVSVSLLGDTVVSLDQSGLIAFWNLQTGRLVAKLQLMVGESRFLSALPNRRSILIQRGTELCEYSLLGEFLQVIGKNAISKNVITWLSDSTLLVGNDTLLHSLQFNTLQINQLETKISGKTNNITYNPIKHQIAYAQTEGQKTTLRVLSFPDLKTLWSHSTENTVWERLYFSSEGEQLVGKTKFIPGKLSSVIVWNSGSGSIINQYQSSSFAKQEMWFARNGQDFWQTSNQSKPILLRFNSVGHVVDSITSYYPEKFWLSENGNQLLYANAPQSWVLYNVESKVTTPPVVFRGDLSANVIWQDYWWSAELLDTFPAITKIRCRNTKHQQWVWEQTVAGKTCDLNISPGGLWVGVSLQSGVNQLFSAHTGVPKFELLITPSGSLAVAQEENYYCWGVHRPYIQQFSQSFSPSKIIEELEPESNPFYVGVIHKLEKQRSGMFYSRPDSLPRTPSQTLFLLVIAPEKVADTSLTRFSGVADALALEKHLKLTKSFASVNVEVLKGKNVSNSSIINLSNWLEKAKSTDLVWIYIIGNGVVTNDGELGIATGSFKINAPNKQDIITAETFKQLFGQCAAKFRWIFGDLVLGSMLRSEVQPSLKLGAFVGGRLKYRIRNSKVTTSFSEEEAIRLFSFYAETISAQTQSSVLCWYNPSELLWLKGNEVFSPFTRMLLQHLTPGVCRNLQISSLPRLRAVFKHDLSHILNNTETVLPPLPPR